MAAPDFAAAPAQPGLRLLFTALRPAARLAVAAGVPFDAARDMLVGALMAETERRRPDLTEMALALGRSTRQVRTLLRTGPRGFESRGENLVERAERLLRTPMTLAELTRNMPRYYAFDAAEVAVQALVRMGRVRVDQPRVGPAVYHTVAAPKPAQAPADHAARVAAVAEHLVGVGGALNAEAPPLTGHARLTPAQAAQLDAEIAAFVEAGQARLEARAAEADDAERYQVYMGLSGEARPRVVGTQPVTGRLAPSTRRPAAPAAASA